MSAGAHGDINYKTFQKENAAVYSNVLEFYQYLIQDSKYKERK
jgi:hypothetical protein